MTTDYQKQYYKEHKDVILPRIRENQRTKYNNDLEYKLLKRYQSRIDNYFGTKIHKAEDLLKCTPEFFVNWIVWCKKDMNKSKQPWSSIELGHDRWIVFMSVVI